MTTKEKFRRIAEEIDGYFAECDAVNEERGGLVKPYTLSGLLCYLGITREEYRKMLTVKKYAAVLNKAAMRIESYIEENVLTGELSVNAGANSLKYNFGWGEKTHPQPEPNSSSVTVCLGAEAQNFAK